MIFCLLTNFWKVHLKWGVLEFVVIVDIVKGKFLVIKNKQEHNLYYS